MRARLLAALRGLLLIWGALSLAGVVGVGLSASYRYGRGNRDRVDSASVGDVGFVLNWCELGADRIAEVVHSYVSARSLTGDHLDAYAIRITRIDPTELTPPSMPSASQWYPGDKLPPVVSDAVDFVGGWLDDEHIPWFPKEAELRSGSVFVYPWFIHVHGTMPIGVQLIFVRPSDKMVFYFSGQE